MFETISEILKNFSQLTVTTVTTVGRMMQSSATTAMDPPDYEQGIAMEEDGPVQEALQGDEEKEVRICDMDLATYGRCGASAQF